MEGETFIASTVCVVEGTASHSPHFLLWRVNLKWGEGGKGVKWKMRLVRELLKRLGGLGDWKWEIGE